MPLRDYRCGACNHEFENLDRTTKKLRTCPQCKKPKLEVVFNKLAEYHNLRSPLHPDLRKGKVRR